VRIALEINLLYTDMRQVTTNLTDSQIVSHNHYAKTTRNPITIRIMFITPTVMRITIVNMTATIRYTAMIQASNDNQRH
jgi:hypothetical protein